MNKRYLALLPILILALASCRPIYTDSSSEEISSVDTSSEVTSEDLSSYSETTSHEHSSEEGTSEGQTSDTTSETTTSEETTSETTSEETTSETTSEEPTSEEPTSEEPTSEEPSSEEPTSEEPSSEEHHHEYSDEWTYDDNEHWHECLDPNCHERKDVASHSYTSEVIKEPTYIETGTRRYTCICGKYYDELIPVKEHHYASTWSYDENTHWHACTDAGFENLKNDEAPHSFGAPTFKEEKDYMTYKKGINTYSCSCGYSKQETVYYTKAEMAELMNEYIEYQDYFDVFELRDLLKNTYPINDFGYDTETAQIVVYTEPTEGIVSFKEREVSSVDELLDAVSKISSYDVDYSTVVLTKDITTQNTINIVTSSPIQIDLNGHTLSGLEENDAVVGVSRGNGKPTVAIVNGTITTPTLSGFDLHKTAKCVALNDANTLRITNCTLNNRAEMGYAFIDYPDPTLTARVKIEDSTLTSPVVAICIQTNTNFITNNEITGVVCINGGSAYIVGNSINVHDVQKGMDNEANRLITSTEIAKVCEDVFITSDKNTYMVTATDSIIIYDRRSAKGTYQLGTVFIEDNTLTCKLYNTVKCGYGIRYIDLDFDPNQDDNNVDNVHIGDNNTYTDLGSGQEPYNTVGGYTFI